MEVVSGHTKKWIYLYDGWDIVGVMGENGSLMESFTRGLGHAGDIGALVAVTHHTGGNEGTYYTHNNHRGDIVLVRNGTTTTVTYDYSAFGKLTSFTGTDLCRFKFSSKEREESCDFSYYGHRFYAPQWQRWINRDPIGEAAGRNLFSFVVNQPVNYSDLLGLDWNEGYPGTFFPNYPSRHGEWRPQPVTVMPRPCGPANSAVGVMSLLSTQYDPAAGMPLGASFVQLWLLLRPTPQEVWTPEQWDWELQYGRLAAPFNEPSIIPPRPGGGGTPTLKTSCPDGVPGFCPSSGSNVNAPPSAYIPI